MTRTAEPQLLTVQQVMARLGCSKDTVLRAIHRGHLPALHYGRVYRVAPADLDRFLDQHRTKRSA